MNTYEDYTGIWFADDFFVHLVMWAKPASDPEGSYDAPPNVQSLTIRCSTSNQILLDCEHVTLRRYATEGP